MPLHRLPLAALLVALALTACNSAPPRITDPQIERGTALPPPGLSEAPARH